MDDGISVKIYPKNMDGHAHYEHNAIGPVSCASKVYLIRPELTLILNIYGRMVAAGKWRDYAIDMLNDRAIFSVFKRTRDMPLYQIIKEPALHTKQGQWRITTTTGHIVKRGHILRDLLRYFDRHHLKPVP